MTIDKLAWIVVDRGRLLMVRSRGRERFYLPGGKREAGESDLAALAREVREELSVTLKVETAEAVGVFEALADGRSDGALVRLTAYRAAFEGTLAPAAEIEELAWLGPADRPRISAAGWLVLEGLGLA